MRPKLKVTTLNSVHTIRLSSDLIATVSSEKKALKLQTKINKSIEHSFLKQNISIERALPILHEYINYLEISEVSFLLKDIEGFHGKIIRLRQLEGGENYNHWLLQAHNYRKNLIENLLNCLCCCAKKRSESSRIVLLEILEIENSNNCIFACFKECCYKSDSTVIKMRTA